MKQPGYVLMTAAYNEEAFIGSTIESVLAQTVQPLRWIVISDGSVDKTDQIIQQYACKHSFIRFLRVSREPGRSFRSKVNALQRANEHFAGLDFDFIGNLDADISLDPSYFAELLNGFEANARLGLAGGFVYEEEDGALQSRRSNRIYSVAHAAQLVRRRCYEEIGGYAVLEYGGEDWHAQTCAQMKGWEIRAFPDLRIIHHRHTGTGDNLLRHRFRQGRMDHSFGSSPWFEILKCLERFPERPFILGGSARLLGFFWSYIQRTERPVTSEFIAYLRQEQKQKMSSLIRRWRHPRQLGAG